MWSVKVIILLPFCYAFQSTQSGKVQFVSKNFYNKLHWKPVEPVFPGETAFYSVKYRSDDSNTYHVKEECQNISVLVCDLTAETPALPDVHYVAEVFVNGSFHGRTKHRFTPVADTVLGPANLSTYTTVSSLHVDVTLPLGPNGVSIADIINKNKVGPSKTDVVYILNITSPEGNSTIKNTTGNFVIPLKYSRRQYCGSVAYRPESELHRWSEVADFCATLQDPPDDPPLTLWPWFLVAAALLVVIISMSIGFMCNYVKAGKEKSFLDKWATSTGTPHRVLSVHDKKDIISMMAFCPTNDKTHYVKIQVERKVASSCVGGYSPQDIPGESWQSSAESSVNTGSQTPPPNPIDTSNRSSELSYTMVVHVPAEEQHFDQATNNLMLSSSGENWNQVRMNPSVTSHGEAPSSLPNTCGSYPATQLLLDTTRDCNGQLVLPLLLSQIQTTTSETQKKLILTDLRDSYKERPSLASVQSFDTSEWLDSGCEDSTQNTPTQPYCNTNYAPSQPVVPEDQQGSEDIKSGEAISESGYKQNWMPSVLPGSEYRRTGYFWGWTGHKMNSECEEKGIREEERLTDSLFGGWGLKIQE